MGATASRGAPGAFPRVRRAIGEWLTEQSRSDRITARPALLARRLLGKRGRDQSRFVLSYLGGLTGIEIGASAYNDYALNAINVDRYGSMNTIYKEEERRLTGRCRAVDVVAPGHSLPFEDAAADFVFASHVLEHIPDPIRALEEWLRVARKYVVVVVPHRERTSDHDRDLTPVDELVQRHAEGFDDQRDLHWSVWTLESFLDLCRRLELEVVDALDPDDKIGNGFIVVLDATRAGHG